MNKRTVSIIHKIIKSKESITITNLAQKYDVSERTIRNDINAINDILSKHKIPKLELKNGGQIAKTDEFLNIIPLVSTDDFYTYKLSKQERIKIASALLVQSTNYITLSEIADKLLVSRATIINDLDNIKRYIKKENLNVLSRPNKGLFVIGKESDKRTFLMRLASPKTELENSNNVFEKLINKHAENKMIIEKILNEQEHIHESFLIDDSFKKIKLYLLVMVNRNYKGEYIEVQNKIEKNSKYDMAQDILKYISQYCHITTSKDEILYLSEILKVARYIKQKSFKKDAFKIQMITRKFIEKISEELEMDLNKDYNFFENLSNHLESVFTAETPNYTDSPSIRNVIKQNQNVFIAVKKHLNIIQKYVNREIQEIEIIYIAIHVCAAIERKKNKEIAFHVILVCHGGIGTSQLLMERLKNHFNFQIVDIVSSHEARNIQAGQADFLISTVKLKECKLDYIVVSPLLSDEDYIRVGKKIDTLRNRRNLPSRIGEKDVTAKGLLDRLNPVIYNIAPQQAPVLLQEIEKVVIQYFHQSKQVEEKTTAPYLHNLLTKEMIQLDIACEDWKDSIVKSAQQLLDKGFIEQRYIDAMITNIEENGPYIVLSKGFAVPHAGLQDGCNKVGMSLIRLKHPVPFGADDLDPVEFVCCFSTIDHQTHLKAFFHLVNIFNKEEFKQKLQTCQTSEQAAQLIKQFEFTIQQD